jgi:hypothetical protein
MKAGKKKEEKDKDRKERSRSHRIGMIILSPVTSFPTQNNTSTKRKKMG